MRLRSSAAVAEVKIWLQAANHSPTSVRPHTKYATKLIHVMLRTER